VPTGSFRNLFPCFSNAFLTLLIGQRAHLAVHLLPKSRIVLQLSQVRPRLHAKCLELGLLLDDLVFYGVVDVLLIADGAAAWRRGRLAGRRGGRHHGCGLLP
jgi:hypothetical protein